MVWTHKLGKHAQASKYQSGLVLKNRGSTDLSGGFSCDLYHGGHCNRNALVFGRALVCGTGDRAGKSTKSWHVLIRKLHVFRREQQACSSVILGWMMTEGWCIVEASHCGCERTRTLWMFAKWLGPISWFHFPVPTKKTETRRWIHHLPKHSNNFNSLAMAFSPTKVGILVSLKLIEQNTSRRWTVSPSMEFEFQFFSWNRWSFLYFSSTAQHRTSTFRPRGNSRGSSPTWGKSCISLQPPWLHVK